MSTDQSDVYRDDRTYDKCKWERAWGELNAALHARVDAEDIAALLNADGPENRDAVEDIVQVFNEIAEKHNVETFDECWDDNVEECDDHPEADQNQ